MQKCQFCNLRKKQKNILIIKYYLQKHSNFFVVKLIKHMNENSIEIFHTRTRTRKPLEKVQTNYSPEPKAISSVLYNFQDYLKSPICNKFVTDY